MKNLTAVFLLLFLPLLAEAQYLTGIATRWNDSFVEWLFFTENEDEEGELKMRWQLQNDWTQWEYRLNDQYGTIKLKWRDNLNEWELRGGNKIVTARTLWTDDPREWRITNNNKSLTLKSKWSNQSDEWELRSSNYGNFIMYTNWERDPRDWVIIDELSEEISLEMKMMLIFIVVYHSSPKQ
jgi:hypothetical protein